MSSLRQLLTGAHFSRSELERHFRDHARSHYLGDNRALARVLGKFTMSLPTRDQSVVPHLLMDGYWEMWLTLAVARHVQPGMSCVDVGANVGYYTLLFAELAGGSIVHSFEPVKEARWSLKDSIKLSGYERSCVVHEDAVSNELGFTAMASSVVNLGSSRIVPKSTEKTVHFGESSVRTIRLDEAVKRADFVKVDVEGAEARVWSGMKGLFTDQLVVMMEFDAEAIVRLDGDGSAERLLSRIKSDGFVLRSVDPDGKIVAVTEMQAMQPDTGTHRTLWLTRGG